MDWHVKRQRSNKRKSRVDNEMKQFKLKFGCDTKYYYTARNFSCIYKQVGDQIFLHNRGWEKCRGSVDEWMVVLKGKEITEEKAKDIIKQDEIRWQIWHGRLIKNETFF